ncbi:MAG: nucleotidyl transferase AbiEii/AbiGii toxin family protein [Nocardioidaceae bacterium]
MEGDTDATRLGFERAEAGEGNWLPAAVAYAATVQGRAHLLDDLLPVAIDLGDEQRRADLHAAVLRGERQCAAVDEVTRRATRRIRAADRAELDRYTSDFAVARTQIRRDHAISHVLGALADSPATDQLIFYGGPALSRTLLPQLRLSEDVDLIACGDRAEVAEHVVALGAAREVPDDLGAVHRRFDPLALEQVAGHVLDAFSRLMTASTEDAHVLAGIPEQRRDEAAQCAGAGEQDG